MTANAVAMTKARSGWGEALPDWVRALAVECDLTSQARAAYRLGYSPGAINSVLSNKYKASMKSIEQTVRGVLMAETVTCPVLGKIGTDKCRMWRERSKEFSAANSTHVRMFKTCPTCPMVGDGE
ncbi:hypothetical protein [Tritonibacter scottomollicae]|uniref:Transcriptional regulator n=1 Tax=Tritonibacter scottomollicae TaxID=483013 RepID=A0A2T1AIA5_TRISK|nr:hypothetical protein [Tritonibacter scottomollicae]PRZ48326.1 hypothetical protein CLV89_104154 [Tritonibacter scottomollicae]